MLITGIFVSLFILLITLPKAIYFLVKAKSAILSKLASGVYLFLQIVSIISSLVSSVLAFFLSRYFYNFGIFFVFLIFSLIAIVLYFFYFVFFIQRGNEPRLLFSLAGKIIAPYTILSTFVIVLASVTTLNFYLLIPASTYLTSNLIIDIVGYKETKPNLSVDPKDEYNEYE